MNCFSISLNRVPSYASVFDLNLSSHTSQINSNIHDHFGCKILTLILFSINMENIYAVFFDFFLILLYFFVTVLAANASLNGQFFERMDMLEVAQKSQAVNFRCTLNDFGIQRDKRS